ncbi:MAG: polysaccharide biosynthesis C-terminal domain-containing protein [Oscillospiraceae bacterium]|nr:polysaccharide biosynthesis C-terminal domain-containing protein [Oscillospiraceae bacterium]
MNKYQKLLNNTLIFAIGTFGSKLLSFILVRLYTGCMTTAQYGTADLLYQAANVIYPIVTLSMADALIRFGIDKAYDNKKIYTIALTTTAGGLAVLLLFTPLINSLEAFRGYGLLLFVYCFFSSFKQLAASFVRARGLVKLFAIDGIFSTLIIVVSNLILLLKFDLGVTGYVCSIIISDALSLLGLVIISELYKFFDIKSLDKTLFKEIVKYSLPLVPTYILWWITSASDRYFVIAMVNSAENGIYSAAHKIPTLLLLVTTLFYQAWQMSAIENKDDSDLSGYYKQVYGAYSSLLFIAAAGLIMIAKPFTYILVDNDPEKNFVFGYHYTPILIIAMIFQCLCQFLSSIYNVRKKSVNSMVTSIVAAVVNIVLDILLIPRLGAYGAGIATMTAYFACFMVRVFDTRSYVKFDISWFRMIVNMIVVGYMAIVAITEPKAEYVQLIVLFIAVAVFNFDAVLSTLKNFITVKRKKKVR